MGLIVTTHTNRYIYKEGHLLQRRLPPERHREITPLRDLIDAGVTVGLATDNVPVSMLWPIWQSIARQDRVTNERVSPEQILTRAEALRCATHNNAFLTFDEDRKGSLEPGKLADLVILRQSPLTDIHNTTNIEYVMKDGVLYKGDTLDEVWPQSKPLAPLWWWNDTPQ